MADALGVASLQERWDLLRTWSAERGTGSWAVLRDACRHLDLDGPRVARRLASLGHLELDWSRGRWAVPETCLVELEEPPGRLLVTGAVTAATAGEIDAALVRAGVDAMVLGPFGERGRGPSSIHVEAGSEVWPELEEACGLAVVPAFSRRLAALLPPADPFVVGVAHVVDQRLRSVTLTDTGDALTTVTAEVRPDGQRLPWVRMADGRARRLASLEWSPYVVPPPGDPLVRHDAARRVLAVNASAPLPPLHNRVACLCAGRVPRRAFLAPGVAEDRYLGVPVAVAEPLLRSLLGAAA